MHRPQRMNGADIQADLVNLRVSDQREQSWQYVLLSPFHQQPLGRLHQHGSG